MNDLQVFSNTEFGSVRTITIDGKIMFVGKDVADILEYTNTAKAIRDHVDDEDKLTERTVLSGQNREVIFINESGLYKEIDDECTKCGRIFECDLFKTGHGIDCKRSNVTDMVKCQFEHLDKRKGGRIYET